MIDNQIEENLELDYKAADSLGRSDGKKKEVAKDVSAMANSNGGRIIYGVAEFQDKQKKHLPEKIDPVKRQDYSKEWLENIITSNISPKIDGLQIIPVPVEGSNENVIYVVDIPKTVIGHQVSTKKDYRYYKRFNFKSEPMPDYELRDVMNRRIFPELTIGFFWQAYTWS